MLELFRNHIVGLLITKLISSIYIPRSCSQCGEPSLEHSLHQYERILPGKQEVDSGKGDAGMNNEPRYHGDDVESESLGHLPDVVKVKDLTTDQKHYTNRGIPGANEQMSMSWENLSSGWPTWSGTNWAVYNHRRRLDA